VNKRKNFWENGGKLWIWILIIVFFATTISQASIALFKSNQAYEYSQKNKDMIISNDKKIAVFDERLKNIEKTTDEINQKIDRALRR